MTGSLDVDTLARDLECRGWTLVESLIDEALVDDLVRDLDHAYAIRRRIQVERGLGEGTEGTCHHLVGDGDSFLELLDRMLLHDVHRRYFNGPYILNSFGAVLAEPGHGSYVTRPHRDVRTFTRDLKLLDNVLVMLSDFTKENGATHLLDGSHASPDRPDREEFLERSSRAIGPKGTVVLFDANVWHAAGENRSDGRRLALTLTFSLPFVKQQADYPRILGYERMGALTEAQRQVLGYYARVPADLDEWYRPPDERFYRSNQG